MLALHRSPEGNQSSWRRRIHECKDAGLHYIYCLYCKYCIFCLWGLYCRYSICRMCYVYWIYSIYRIYCIYFFCCVCSVLFICSLSHLLYLFFKPHILYLFVFYATCTAYAVCSVYTDYIYAMSKKRWKRRPAHWVRGPNLVSSPKSGQKGVGGILR